VSKSEAPRPNLTSSEVASVSKSEVASPRSEATSVASSEVASEIDRSATYRQLHGQKLLKLDLLTVKLSILVFGLSQLMLVILVQMV